MKSFLWGGGGRRDLRVKPGLTVVALLYLSLLAGLVFAVVPSVYSVLWSFFGTSVVGILDATHTWKWFLTVLNDSEWRSALGYSVILAMLAAGSGSLLLLVHFYYIRYSRPLLDRLGYGLVVLLALIPTVVYALALRWAYGAMSLWEWVPLAIGQLITTLPVQFFILESSQELAPDDLLFAGSAAGATHMTNLWSVYFPIVRRAWLGSLLVGFFIAFDELVLATFMIDSLRVTAPRRLWDQINSKMDPTPAVVSTLLGAVFLVGALAPVALRSLRALRREVAGDSSN